MLKKEGRPALVLVADDQVAPMAVRAYAQNALMAGASEEHVTEILAVAEAMEAWQKEHPDQVNWQKDNPESVKLRTRITGA